MPVPELHLRPELRLQGRQLQLRPCGAPLNTIRKRCPEPAPPPAPDPPGKDIAMRMLFIMGGSLVLALGLRLLDPPVAAAAPACGPSVPAR